MLQYHKFNVGVSKEYCDRGLLKTEKGFYVSNIHTCDKTAVGKVTFLLFGLFGQDVALERVFSFDLS